MALQDVIERIRTLDTPPNEEATKLQMVLPILRELGWDDADPGRVHPEYRNGRGDRVDYALLSPQGGVAAVVEAKPMGSKFDILGPGTRETPEDQVLRYAHNLGVDVCVLASGSMWWLYLPRERGKPAERRFAELDITKDSVDQLCEDFETYLGYDELVGQRAESHAKRVLEAKLNSERLSGELPRVWSSMLSAPPQELIDLLEGRVFSSIRLRPSREQVADFLRSQGGVSTDGGSEPASAPISQSRSTPGVSRPAAKAPRKPEGRLKAPSVPPSAILLFGQEHPVTGWGNTFLRVAEVLYRRHPDRFSMTVGRPRGKRSYVETDRTLMRLPHQVADSPYWVGCHGDAAALKGRCAHLLELFGYSGNDLALVFD